MDLSKNADRFQGFADTYETARPALPLYPVEILTKYLGRMPEKVIDLGCGTGLSTTVWKGRCQQVIGVEPSLDMLNAARKKQTGSMEFIQGYAHETQLPEASADVVVCSQSFHWMDPSATLQEVNRILKPGGIFATVDCDWPPVSVWEADCAYDALYDKVKQLEAETPEVKDTFIQYSKEKHLSNIRESGYFRYTRELLFANRESCTADRYFRIIMSQGSLQAILKRRPELIQEDVEQFRKQITKILGDSTFTIDFSYRMRLGVK